MKGRLFVVEGADASGKATQSKLLLERLRREGHAAELVSFPRYGSAFGKLVKDYLHGKFGAKEAVPIEFVSLLYALDRYDAMKPIEKMLAGGKIVVADRYTASNIAHQGAKLSGKERASFIEWIQGVEERLPAPALTIYLDVPTAVAQSLMKSRGTGKDLHEADAAYLERARGIYLQLAESNGWVKIDCVKEGRLLSINEAHGLVWEKVKQYV